MAERSYHMIALFFSITFYALAWSGLLLIGPFNVYDVHDDVQPYCSKTHTYRIAIVHYNYPIA